MAIFRKRAFGIDWIGLLGGAGCPPVVCGIGDHSRARSRKGAWMAATLNIFLGASLALAQPGSGNPGGGGHRFAGRWGHAHTVD